jgi:ElaB/YqjD/DUF883 family membrane-anchored ribosome-binding protein
MNANEHATARSLERIAADRMRSDLQMLAADAEQLLRATADHTGDRIGEVRARVLESLAGVKARAGDFRDDTLNNARAAGRVADDYVHDNPWRIVAIGALAGLGLGLLVGLVRGSSSDY